MTYQGGDSDPRTCSICGPKAFLAYICYVLLELNLDLESLLGKVSSTHTHVALLYKVADQS